MKAKIFTGNPGEPLFMEGINKFLARDHCIKFINQSESDGENGFSITISIFYDDSLGL